MFICFGNVHYRGTSLPVHQIVVVHKFLVSEFLCCRYVCGQRGLVTLEKQWQSRPTPFAYQTIVTVGV